jgi:hypothetical protein
LLKATALAVAAQVLLAARCNVGDVVVERFRQGGSDATSTTPAAFAALVEEDYEKWGKVVRRLGVTAN